MALLNDEIVNNVKQMLSDLPQAVKLVVFTTAQCDYCKEIVQLAQEVAATSDKITVELYKLESDTAPAKQYNITMAPVIVIAGAKDYGIRYYGIPSGHEFQTLLHGIRKASFGQPEELATYDQTYLANLDQPVNIQVFVTPTCPYCPPAAIRAYDMAIASDKVVAEVIESMEFQELAMQFNVMGVPLNVINGKERLEGAAPPAMVIDKIRAALA
ncbi:MAG: thioredoxin family protein [Anaerolineae bacterium]|nr:thioredoxin family protein [Anaerolineae bacterium]